MDGRHWSLKVTTPSTIEPVSEEDLRDYLCLGEVDDPSGSQTLLQRLIRSARERCERVTGFALMTQTLTLTLDHFPCGEGEIFDGERLLVPRPPLQSVTSISYVDTGGTTQTLGSSNYRVDTASIPGRIEPAWGVTWPSVRDIIGAVTVVYVAGYTARVHVPAEMTDRILQCAAYCFERAFEDRDESWLDELFRGQWLGCYL
jgi:uncharacterized phiE125 gp8 family phage protein